MAKQKSSRRPKKSTLSSKKIKLQTVQTLANKYARLRDTFGTGGAACISCGVWKSFEELDGGHFIPTTVSSTRFDERNINAQCHRCNRFLHGNQRGYFRGLEKKLGRSELDDLEAGAAGHKWTQDELKALKEYYAEKIKRIEAGEDPRTDNQSMDMQSMFKDLDQAR